MTHIEATPAATEILAKVPGLRVRVEEVLCAILETAVELRDSPSTQWVFPDREAQFMRVRVADHMISYVLDLGRPGAKIVFVERVSSPGPVSNVA